MHLHSIAFATHSILTMNHTPNCCNQCQGNTFWKQSLLSGPCLMKMYDVNHSQIRCVLCCVSSFESQKPQHSSIQPPPQKRESLPCQPDEQTLTFYLFCFLETLTLRFSVCNHLVIEFLCFWHPSKWILLWCQTWRSSLSFNVLTSMLRGEHHPGKSPWRCSKSQAVLYR